MQICCLVSPIIGEIKTFVPFTPSDRNTQHKDIIHVIQKNTTESE